MTLTVNYKLLSDCLKGAVYWPFTRDQGRETCAHLARWKFSPTMVSAIENHLYPTYHHNLRNIASNYETMPEHTSEGTKQKFLWEKEAAYFGSYLQQRFRRKSQNGTGPFLGRFIGRGRHQVHGTRCSATLLLTDNSITLLLMTSAIPRIVLEAMTWGSRGGPSNMIKYSRYLELWSKKSLNDSPPSIFWQSCLFFSQKKTFSMFMSMSTCSYTLKWGWNLIPMFSCKQDTIQNMFVWLSKLQSVHTNPHQFHKFKHIIIAFQPNIQGPDIFAKSAWHILVKNHICKQDCQKILLCNIMSN